MASPDYDWSRLRKEFPEEFEKLGQHARGMIGPWTGGSSGDFANLRLAPMK
jgi:hypothetical protein